MKQQGGAINVYRQPGAGTTFRLYFPATDAADGGRGEAREAPVGHGERVLFLDDEPALVEFGRQALERLGYKVTGFTDVAQALAAVADRPAGFDLVVTDFTMPRTDGVKFAELLHAVSPGLPIVLTTGNTLSLPEDAIRRTTICAVLTKPHSIQTLAEAVHRALATQQAA
jgi:DNA-binding NtrC family response regulator